MRGENSLMEDLLFRVVWILFTIAFAIGLLYHWLREERD
jgi:hypothetical protein